MKSIFILFITTLFLPNIESNTYNLQIKEILTQEACACGLFVLDAELNTPMKEEIKPDKGFKLYLRNSIGKEGYTDCFLFHYPETTAVKIGCVIYDFNEAVYQILSTTETKSYTLYGHTINILPYSIKMPFWIINGLEFYYYSPKYEIKLNFLKEDEESNLEFYLFAGGSDLVRISITILLDDISFDCKCLDGQPIKLFCPVKAKDFIQEREHIYMPNLIDTNGRVKRNYFTNPIEITLEYIEE